MNNISVNTSETGVVIAKVESGCSAEKAGLKKGDVITKFDDNKVTSISTLRYYLYQYKVGDTIKVTVIRDGKTKELNVTLASSKQTT